MSIIDISTLLPRSLPHHTLTRLYTTPLNSTSSNYLSIYSFNLL